MNDPASSASRPLAAPPPPSDRPLLAVLDLVTSVGGVQTVMAELLPRLAARHRVAVLDPYRNPDYARLLPGAIEQVALGEAPAQRFIGGAGGLERVARLAARAPWLAATGLRVRRWAQQQRPAVVYFNQLPTVLFFSRFLPSSGPALVYHAHGFASPSDVRGAAYLARRCSRLFAVSQAVADLLAAAGVPASKVSVVYNGVDAPELRRRARLSGAPLPERAAGEVVVVHAAVHAPNKQQHLAIEALTRLPPNVVLWLCGDVPPGGDPLYARSLRQTAARLGVGQRVRFLGWRDDVPAVLAAADVAILPSLKEGMPRVLVEAMALGLPCVGTDTGGIPEIIEHRVTGFVTAPAPAALAAALSPLVGSAEARQRLGRAGQERAERLFDAGRQAALVASALDALVPRRARDAS